MVIWTDAHLSLALAPWLQATFGVKAAPLRALRLRDTEDAAIFAAARAAGAVLMTKDSDFVALLSRHGPPPRIVWLTCGNTQQRGAARNLGGDLASCRRVARNGRAADRDQWKRHLTDVNRRERVTFLAYRTDKWDDHP